MLLHSQMLYEYHKVNPYLTFLRIRFSSSKDRLWCPLKACWVIFSRRDHHRTGPLMAAREKAKRNKYILPTFCHDGPRLAITAKEVIAGCLSLMLQKLPFVQARKGQYMYAYSLLYASCTGSILLLVVLLSWSIHSSHKLVKEQTGAETSNIRKLFFTRTWVKD